MAEWFLLAFRIREIKIFRLICLLLVFFMVLPFHASYSQYFGKNKPKYKTFDFRVFESPHFEIYHYLDSDSTAQALTHIHELWFNKHQAILKDTFDAKNPIVIYNHHADFQQTTTIPDLIGIGTGGVTEGLKNRVIFPLLETNGQTSHVIGHELVHAFQYNMLKSGDSTSLGSIRNLPLWMVEGLAEYMSIGRVDAHTAMWIRDSYLNQKLPSLEDLSTDPSYFPYRYGQAFWSFVTGIWGDETIRPLFLATAKYGYEAAVDTVLKLKSEEVSSLWQNSIERHCLQFSKDTSALAGNRLLDQKESGNINFSPVYSPNGEYMAFISEKDVISIDIYLMDVKNGRVIRKLSDATDLSHIDDFNYIETVGTFSPDNSLFAYSIVSKGRNYLAVVDVNTGKTLRNIRISELEVFNNPSWSPDGRYILFSGLSEGQSDLYLYDYYSDELERLTNDLYSDIHGSWSSDGNSIVFSSDRGDDTDLQNFRFGSFRLCLLDLHSRKFEILDLFPGADNLNPKFSPDNQRIYFLSDSDGFRNLYVYNIEKDVTHRMTKYFTGISGITKFSPALSVARNTGSLAYSLYRGGKYTIYLADPDDKNFIREKVEPNQVNFLAATLPPEGEYGNQTNKQTFEPYHVQQTSAADSLFKQIPFKPKFELDYIGNHTIGVSAGRFGTGLSGGLNALFSDILGNQRLFGAIALNGEIYDMGGQLAYFNQRRIFQWGASVSFIPYRSAAISYFPDEIDYGDSTLQVIHEALDILRTYEAQIGVFAYYPFSKQRRVEAAASFARYHYRLDRLSNYYYQGIYAGAEREKLPTPDGFNISRIEAAFVEDNTTFGLVGPLEGRRFRFSAEQFFGAADFRAYLGDYRHYFRFKPFTLAYRLYHYGRYGKSEDSELLPPLYLGFPTLVRGYSGNSFSRNLSIETGGFNINQLMGSRIMVSNAELRLPFTGPERLALFKFNLIPSELSLYFDGGIAWDAAGYTTEEMNNMPSFKRKPVFSTGLSLRLNILGYMVLEPYYAIPLQRNFQGGEFGLNFSPSW